jgi:hypothetical protein
MHFVGFCVQILVIKCYSSWLTLGVVPLAAVETSGNDRGFVQHSN